VGETLEIEESGLLGVSAMEQAEPSSASPMEDATSLSEVQRRHIESVLEQTSWVIEGQRGAARLLNLHPNTLRFRMQKLGIIRPARARKV
jgi:transcriptional regulator with GAF, ATPase, and Fis domain